MVLLVGRRRQSLKEVFQERAVRGHTRLFDAEVPKACLVLTLLSLRPLSFFY